MKRLPQARGLPPAASRDVGSAWRGMFGFTRAPRWSTPLEPASCSSSSRFAASSVVKMLTPVALPPGRLRLATSPSSTGSAAGVEHDRDGGGRGLGRNGRGVAAGRHDHRDLALNEIGRQAGSRSYWPSAQRYSIATLRPSMIADLLQASTEAGRRERERVRRRAAEKSDHRHRRLLRPRRERPRGRRAAEQRDELAPFSFDHLIGAGEQRSAARRGRATWRS